MLVLVVLESMLLAEGAVRCGAVRARFAHSATAAMRIRCKLKTKQTPERVRCVVTVLLALVRFLSNESVGRRQSMRAQIPRTQQRNRTALPGPTLLWQTMQPT